MYTIGQFSRICRVTTKALRHYEKMGIISPARVEQGSQYRYYTQEQAPIVQNVLYLKELGIPLADTRPEPGPGRATGFPGGAPPAPGGADEPVQQPAGKTVLVGESTGGERYDAGQKV